MICAWPWLPLCPQIDNCRDCCGLILCRWPTALSANADARKSIIYALLCLWLQTLSRCLIHIMICVWPWLPLCPEIDNRRDFCWLTASADARKKLIIYARSCLQLQTLSTRLIHMICAWPQLPLCPQINNLSRTKDRAVEQWWTDTNTSHRPLCLWSIDRCSGLCHVRLWNFP